MKSEKDIEEIIDEIKIPSDEEVEAAGLRFDRRIHRIKKIRRIMWTAGSVAAVMLSGFIFSMLWNEKEEVEVVEIAKSSHSNRIEQTVMVPTLILPDGKRLIVRDIDTTIQNRNIQITDNCIKYDTTPVIREEIEYNTMVIPPEYTYHVTLADGTEVIMNAGSRLRYPTNFVGDSRVVELSGEAYFKVTKSYKPFEVIVGNSKIQVYGTQFNVKCTHRNTIETVLVEGKIGFSSPGQDEVQVSPGERVTFNHESGNIEVEPVDVQYATAWLEGVFKYRDKSLDVVLEDLSTWYGVRFEPETDISMIEVTMKLSKKTSIDEAISFIELMTNCKFVKEERGYYIVKHQ